MLLRRREVPTSIVLTLTKAQVFEGKSMSQLLNSLSEARFKNHFNTSNMLIEVRSLRALFPRYKKVTFDLGVYLLVRILQRKFYFSFVCEVLKYLFLQSFHIPHSIREAKREIFDTCIYKIIDSQLDVKIDFVVTNSTLSKLPQVIFSNLVGKSVMMWYSTNSRPIALRGQKGNLTWNPEILRKNIDEHLVWTKFDVEFLCSLGLDNAIEVGSILFLPKVQKFKQSQKYLITYFDITPLSPHGEGRLGITTNFYSEKSAISDLESILKLSEYLQREFRDFVKVRIKPKRKYSTHHSKAYITLLKNAVTEKKIELLPTSENLYKVVSESDLVIGPPWTSPVILAQEVNSDSVFYSINRSDWDLPSKYCGITFIDTAKKLEEYVEFNLKKSGKKLGTLIQD